MNDARRGHEDHVEFVLANGLRVMLKRMPTAPIISHWMWYRVGSRDEKPGKTGLSHWVEHMQFKGTATTSSDSMERDIARKGGMWNAFTFFDWTTYYATLPSSDIDFLMRFEADRMRNTSYTQDEVDSERTVIISELEGSENEPSFRLSQAVQAALFNQHPYRNEVIGLKDDLLNTTYHDLLDHYHTYYRPSNAVLAIAGDFETDEMIKKIQRVYGDLSDGAEPRLLKNRNFGAEPFLTGEARVDLNGPGEMTFVEVSYPTLPANHPDMYAMIIFDSLLSGPTNMNMFGGGSISNKTSRLFKALIDTSLAVGAGGGSPITIDPFLYTFNITLRPDQPVEKALVALDAQIERLQNEPVPVEAIARATKQAKAIFAYGSENITNQAFWLGHSEMFADYTWFQTYLDHLSQVTPDDLTRVAREWFVKDRRAVGVYHPNGEAVEEDEW